MVFQKKIFSNLAVLLFSRTNLLFVPFIICLFSCSELEVVKSAPAVNEVPTDTKFRIILPESHKNAETWQLNADFDDKTVERLNEVWHGEEKGIYFNLKALSVGQTTLTFVKRMYTDTTDYKQFIIKTIAK